LGISFGFTATERLSYTVNMKRSYAITGFVGISTFTLLVVATVIAFGLVHLASYRPVPKSFAECVAAGYAVMESYPRQCRVPGGVTFTEDIGSELSKQNLIRIDNPRPGTKVESPLKVSGQARGYWFFEASFPVSLVDANGDEIGVGIAQAKGDWMTEQFVPFTATLKFTKPTTKYGTLVLKKDNPSGMPENDDQLRVPVTF
jgi:hypothetical protein